MIRVSPNPVADTFVSRAWRKGDRLSVGYSAMLAAWLLVAIQPMTRFSAAGEVVIVKTSNADPYTQAETSMRDRLVEQKHAVRTLLAKQVSDQGIAASIPKTSMVVAIGTPAARWLHKQLPADTRLIYCMVTGPDEAGLLEGNACWGVTTDLPIADQFKLISEALPRARAVGTLYRSDTPEGKKVRDLLQASLPGDWRIEAVAVNDFSSVAAAIEALTKKNVDVIWTTTDQKLYDTASVRALLLAGLRSKIPVWGFSTSFVRAGALMGIGVEPKAQGIQAAGLALQVIANPDAVSKKPQSPANFDIGINLIVAKQLGVEIPDALLRRAVNVFQSEN